MIYKKVIKKIALFGVGLGLMAASYASSLYISPVELFFSKDKPVNVLNIENRGEQAVLLQINENFSQVSKNLVVNPTIFKLPPKSEKSVQVGLKVPPAEEEEQVLNLWLKELAQKVNKTGQINFVIDFAVHAYVMPLHEIKKLVWQVTTHAITLQNASNVHVKVVELYLTRPKQLQKVWEMSQEQPALLLANASQAWPLSLKEKGDFELHAVIYWRDNAEMIYQKVRL